MHPFPVSISSCVKFYKLRTAFVGVHRVKIGFPYLMSLVTGFISILLELHIPLVQRTPPKRWKLLLTLLVVNLRLCFKGVSSHGSTHVSMDRYTYRYHS
jgi:hypothetical protein